MSGVVGLVEVEKKLARFDDLLAVRLAEAIEACAREFQADLVATCPVSEGDLRQALSSPDAVRVKRGRDGVTIEVGLITPEQKKLAFYAFFVEFGTKGYSAGQRRFSGKTKRGQARFTRIKRDIPARPAHPFFRPAFVRLVERLRVARAEAYALALRDMAMGV